MWANHSIAYSQCTPINQAFHLDCMLSINERHQIMGDFLANCICTKDILLVKMHTAIMYPIYIKNALAITMPFTYYYTACISL